MVQSNVIDLSSFSPQTQRAPKFLFCFILMEYYNLPETTAQAAEYLFLYETSGGEELDKQVSFNYDIARITARTKSLSSKDVRTFISDIDSFVKGNIDPSIKVEYTGTMPWVKAMSNYVNQGQKRSFILAFLAITCIPWAGPSCLLL